MTGGQQDTTGSFAYPDDVAGSWGTENAILADQELLDAVCCTDLGDQLRDLWVPVTAVTTDDEE